MEQESGRIWPPKGLTGLLVRRCVAAGADPADADVRARLAGLQGWVGIVANLIIFLVKVVLGFFLGSIAVVADAFDSLSDVGASTLIVLGGRWSRKPRDAEHPFGHGRAELIAALITAVLLIVVGISLGKESLVRIWRPASYVAPWWAIGAVALTIPVKEWLAMFSRKLSRATHSSLIEAGYWHLRFDSLMAALVCFALFCSRMGWVAVDGWVGLVIAVLIVRAGILLVNDRISPLVGEAPEPEELARIEEAGLSVVGVRGVHDIIVHKYGDVHLVSCHIEVDAEQSALDVHEISEEAERAIEGTGECKAIVHVDPVDRGHPMYRRVEDVLGEYVRENEEIDSFHDLRLAGEGKVTAISVDVVVDVQSTESRQISVGDTVKELLREAFGEGIDVAVTVESPYHGGGTRAGS